MSTLIFIICNKENTRKKNPPTDMENDISCWYPISKHNLTLNTHFG